MPSSIKLTEPLDILVEYGYLDDDTPYHKALSNAVMDFAEDPSLGGEYNKDYVMLLQDEAKKELKLRRKKIDVKSFKEKFLNRKEEPVKKGATGTSSIVPYKPPAPTPDLSLPEGEDQQQETEGLKGIRDILDDILKVLRLDFKDDRKEARDAQKQAAKDKREKREDKLEGGGLKKSLGIIGKMAAPLLGPFQMIWDAIIRFLKFTLLGVLLNDTLEWFKDPANQKKAERVGKFFKDWWPALATAAALWLTPLGALLNGVVGLLTAIIPKLVIAIAANPYAAAALIGTGVTVWGISKLASMPSRPTEAVDESVEEIGREETINQLKEEQENRGVMGRVGDFFTGAGSEREQQIERLEGMSDNTGGSGFKDGFSDVKAEQNMGTFTGDGYMKEFEGTAGFQEFNEGGPVQSTQSNQSSNVQNYNEGGLVQSSSNQTNQTNQSRNVQNYNEGGLVQSSSTQSNQSSNVQNYNEGGLVQHYNDQQSAQNFVQKYKEGGLVQNFQGGGFSNITNTETTSNTDSEGNFSFGSTYVSPEEAKERLSAMGMPSMELWDGSIVPNFGKMGADKFMQGVELTRSIMVESGADSAKIEELDNFVATNPYAQPEQLQSVINRVVPGSTEQVLGDMGDSITTSAKMKGGGLVNNYQNFKGGGLVNNYQNFKGGGLVETYNNLTQIKNYKQGGFVSGPGGVDKVPARLTAGEFVMSKGAVQKFGTNTLASMNAAGGGTNVPTITQEYNQGGSVQYLEQEYNQGGLVQYLENGGVVRDVMKEPVGTPIVQSTNKTITLPTIPKQQPSQQMDMAKNEIPEFRIPIVSSQRSMVIASLGIQDLIGG